MLLLDENAAILHDMKKDGSDLGPSRNVDFAHVFPDRVSAQAFAFEAARNGFETKLEEVDRREKPWDVIATKDMAPTAEQITSVEEHLGELAEQQGGMPDGWGFERV